jgi:hypothetical protein
LTASQTNNVNVMGLFPHRERRRYSHEYRTYTSSNMHDVTLDSLLLYVNRKLGLNIIHTRLYSVPLKTLNTLLVVHTCRTLLEQNIDWTLSSWMFAHHMLFKPPQIADIIPESCRQFFKLMFSNKGIDAVNLRNLFRHNKVQFSIPEYWKSRSTPCIS